MGRNRENKLSLIETKVNLRWILILCLTKCTTFEGGQEREDRDENEDLLERGYI